MAFLRLRRKKKFDSEELRQQIIIALKEIYDPEIPVNIYDLGLIYTIDIDAITNVKANVKIRMTLTTPACPVAQTFPGTVENAIKQLPNVDDAEVEIVWDPPWTQESMTEAAKLQLGLL